MVKSESRGDGDGYDLRHSYVPISSVLAITLKRPMVST